MSDARALECLDRLLAADEAERQSRLDELALENPELHARMVRMLASALSPENSRVLALPVLEGAAQLADVTRALTAGDVLAGYRLIRELGRGGMSVVWLAERADGVVKREVALKMPLFMLSGADGERFARERDALAALSHPNVARLYDAGVLPSGQPFIVLERVDGEPLNVFCDARRLDLRARLRLFLQVLGAVEHAHKHLIVHRDLKPSNILVDGEGHARLLDFGIAKLLGESESAAPLTQVSGGAMTPLYAAPEQIRGETISTLTDVFSLGLVLHELLTGVLPYPPGRNGRRATLVEILETLGRGELPLPSQAALEDSAASARGLASVSRLRAELTGDLDTLVSKALRLAPEHRYASAAHLADDLRRLLDHQPIAARRPSFWYSTRLALRRHRLAASVAGVGVALVAGASIVAALQFRESRANAERTAAVRDFMFHLVNDAEAADGQTGEVTFRQMLDGAVARARSEFASQPQLQGELLSELGRMYTRFDADAAAVPVLEESIRVLAGRATADDPALNKTRVFLAGALMMTSNDPERVESLARAARAGCANDKPECLKARGYASNLLSQIAAYSGDQATALAEMRRCAQEIAGGFGAHHEETAMAFVSLATMARNAGEINEAGVAVGHAVDAARGLRLRVADRVLLERTMAVIDHDLGRFEAARDRLLALLPMVNDAAERALLSRILANVYVELGDGQAALRSADSAVTLAGDAGDELPYARQARARALALLASPADALREMDTAIHLFLASGRAEDSFEVLRAQRFRAQFLLMNDGTGALQALQLLKTRHEAAKVPAVETGLMLELLGEAESRAGDAAAARVTLEEARRVLAAQLKAEHPFLVRNAALRDRVK